MTEVMRRRSFFDTPSEQIVVKPADDALLAAAAKNGFASAPKPLATMASPAASAEIAMQAFAKPLRRERPKTGRDHHFTTRLKLETLEYIYSQANGRQKGIAEIIEEMEALHRQKFQE